MTSGIICIFYCRSPQKPVSSTGLVHKLKQYLARGSTTRLPPTVAISATIPSISASVSSIPATVSSLPTTGCIAPTETTTKTWISGKMRNKLCSYRKESNHRRAPVFHCHHSSNLKEIRRISGCKNNSDGFFCPTCSFSAGSHFTPGKFHNIGEEKGLQNVLSSSTSGWNDRIYKLSKI